MEGTSPASDPLSPPPGLRYMIFPTSSSLLPPPSTQNYPKVIFKRRAFPCLRPSCSLCRENSSRPRMTLRASTKHQAVTEIGDSDAYLYFAQHKAWPPPDRGRPVPSEPRTSGAGGRAWTLQATLCLKSQPPPGPLPWRHLWLPPTRSRTGAVSPGPKHDRTFLQIRGDTGHSSTVPTPAPCKCH